MTGLLRLMLIAWLLSAGGVEPPEENPPDPSTAPQQPADDAHGRPHFVGELVVSSTGSGPRAGAGDSLQRAEIQDLGATTVAEALEHLPGVFVSTGGRNEPKAWVRGYEQSNVLVLVDGIPISDPFYGDVDLGQLPVFDVARVTVSRGAASPLYGPGSLGGVINIVTSEGGEGRHLSGELRLAERSTVLAHATTHGTAGDLSWYLGLGSARSDGFTLSDDFAAQEYEDGGLRVNSDFERASLLARVGWQAGESSRLYASVRWIDADKGIPFHTANPTGFTRFARFPEWSQGTYGIGLDHSLEDRGTIRAQLYHHTFDNTLAVYDDRELDSLQLTSEFNDSADGGQVVASLSAGGRHSLGLALHLRRDRHRKREAYADGERIDPSQRYVADSLSLAVQDSIHLGRRITAVLALSSDHLHVHEAASLREGGEGWTLTTDPVKDHDTLSPQAELQVSLGSGVMLSAAAYRRSDFPTMRELYGTDPPNPELEPERVTGAGVGLGLTVTRWLDLRGDVFVDRVRNLIARSSRDLPFTNQDEAEMRGVELRASGSLPWLDLTVGGTLLEAELERSAEGMREVPYAPDSAADLLLVGHLGARLDLRLSAVHTGNRVFYDRGTRRTLGSYRLVNIGADWRWGKTELSLDIDNLLDEDVEQEWGYPMPGRRLWVGVRAGF